MAKGNPKVIEIKDSNSAKVDYKDAVFIAMTNKHSTQAIQYNIGGAVVTLDPQETDVYQSNYPMTGTIRFIFSDNDKIYIKVKTIELHEK